jgi:hypothetical protein
MAEHFKAHAQPTSQRASTSPPRRRRWRSLASPTASTPQDTPRESTVPPHTDSALDGHDAGNKVDGRACFHNSSKDGQDSAAEPSLSSASKPGAEPADLEDPAATRALEYPGQAVGNSLWLQLSPEWQLVAWLGHHNFLEILVPCDITAMIQSCREYERKYSCSSPLWFELVSSWIKDPGVIQTWTDHAPPPTAEPTEVMDALFVVFKSLSSYSHAELGRVLKSGRGTGYMSFFISVGLAKKDRGVDVTLRCKHKGKMYTWTKAFFVLKHFVVLFICLFQHKSSLRTAPNSQFS